MRLILSVILIGLAVVSSLRAQTADETRLIGIIQSSTKPDEKEDACRRLKLIGTAASVPALASLLNDKHLYQAACDALETMPVDAAGKALVSGLKNSKGDARLGIIHALGERRETIAVSALIQLLKDKDEKVASASARALGRIGGDKSARALRRAMNSAREPVRGAVVGGLLQCALQFERDKQTSDARTIYKTLDKERENEHVRCGAFEGVVRTDSTRALELVLQALRKDSSARQAAALQLAAGIQDAKATKAYCELLPVSSPALQMALLTMLQHRADVAAADAVLAQAKNTNAAVRAAAVSALGVLGEAGNVALLAEAATSSDELEQRAGRQALIALRRGKVTEALVANLATANSATQVEIIRALTTRADVAAVEPLLKLARHESPKTRRAACQALSKLGDDRHFKSLVQLIVSAPDDDAREEIRGVFESIADRKEGAAKPNVSPIAAQLKDSGGEVHVVLLQVSALFADPKLRAAFRESLTNSDERVRSGAARALCNSRDPDLLPDLLTLARETKETNLRALAIEGYTRLTSATEAKGYSPQRRTELLRSILPIANRAEDKRVVLAALGNVVCSESLELAKQTEADASVRAEAEIASMQIAKALLTADPGLAVNALKRLGEHASSEPTRNRAKETLKQYDSGWRSAGPYRRSGLRAQELFDVMFPPERANTTNVIVWKIARGTTDLSRTGEVDLKDLVEGDNCVMFLKTRVFVPRAQTASLEIASDDGIKFWVNNKVVHTNNTIRMVTNASDRVEVKLRKGWNDLLAKITQVDKQCGMRLQVLGANGNEIDGLKFDPHGGEREAETNRFETIELSDKFYAEGANVADINRDGKMDIVAGPFWLAGPTFTNRHEYRAAKEYDPHGYSDSFLMYTGDFNGDGWVDIFDVPLPGVAGYWYANPGEKGGAWKQSLVYPMVGNESQQLVDLDGDGRLDMIFNNEGHLGYATYDPAKPETEWTFHAVSPKDGRFQRFTHGVGAGDINGDKRSDLIEAAGWWEQPVEKGAAWKFHAFQFAEAAAQMLVTDVDGDGLNDVIASWHCHRYGLNWFKQKRGAKGEIGWEKQEILAGAPDTRVDTVRFSQLHALALADMNGDGLPDVVTGKRYWAHGPHGDVEPSAPAVVYWFELQRKNGVAKFIPHLIHDDSGIGTQVTAADVNGDGKPDVVVANKKGIFVHVNQIGEGRIEKAE